MFNSSSSSRERWGCGVLLVDKLNRLDLRFGMVTRFDFDFWYPQPLSFLPTGLDWCRSFFFHCFFSLWFFCSLERHVLRSFFYFFFLFNIFNDLIGLFVLLPSKNKTTLYSSLSLFFCFCLLSRCNSILNCSPSFSSFLVSSLVSRILPPRLLVLLNFKNPKFLIIPLLLSINHPM